MWDGGLVVFLTIFHGVEMCVVGRGMTEKFEKLSGVGCSEGKECHSQGW